MPVYFVTGKLGAGKTLSAVGRMNDYLQRGLPIASNIDLNLEKLVGKNAKNTRYIRIPDKPSVFDLESIGIGNDSYDESRNGAIVFDECGTWFNARSWNDKGRQEIINWLLHARKKGWDVFFIVQDISIVDKQAREALAEHVVYCRRLDRVSIPFFSMLFKIFWGEALRFPRFHLAIVKYGDSENSIIVDRWMYRGSYIQDAYDTKQAFTSFYPHGCHSVLPPWHVKGRFLRVYSLRDYMLIIKNICSPVVAVSCLVVGVVFGLGVGLGSVLLHKQAPPAAPVAAIEPAKEETKTQTLRELFDGYRVSIFTNSTTDGPRYLFQSDDPKKEPISSDNPPAGVSFKPLTSNAVRVVMRDDSIVYRF